ncbi:MAG: hypothetical protein HGA65_00365 [Oscillochloris sp.]|nr:hypothetical protein [Oscillochloris sp.]
MIRRSLVALFAVPLICLALGIGIAHSAGAAQGSMDSGLIIDPAQLTISISDGCSRALISAPQGCIQTHRLLLQATQEISGVVAITNDLRRSDDAAILPAGSITVSTTTALEAGDFGTLDISLDLSHVPAGEYSGAIILRHSVGSTRVPITVRTRDYWLLPLLLLLGSLAIGGGLSLYRELRKRPDQLRDQLARLKLQADGDSELLDAFRSAINQRIDGAHQALERDKFDQAESQIGEAEQYLRRWQQARSDWLKLGTRIASEEVSVKGMAAAVAGEENVYQRSQSERLAELRQGLPKMETPQDANQSLKAIAEATSWYYQISVDTGDADAEHTRLGADIESTDNLLSELTSLPSEQISADLPEVQTLQSQLAPLQARLGALAPVGSLQRRLIRLSADNDANKQVLRGDADNLLREVQAIRSELRAIDERADVLMERYGLSRQGSFVLGSADTSGTPPAATDLSPLSDAILKAGRQAQWRLRIYQGATIIVAAILVIPLGMNQLYAANLTFGANPLFDYPALLVWGIGLESTRESVVAMARTMMRDEKQQ